MAFRSVRMRIFNMSGASLAKTGDQLDHGEFTDSFQPPETIAPNQPAEWRAESAGDIPLLGSIGTGTEGSVDYAVVGGGDRFHFEWDNPAVGNTFFRFSPPTAPDGGPSDFVFFATRIALDESVEPDPVNGPPVVAVTQGDLDGEGVILPLPLQPNLIPHAWFDIGIRDRREPISVRDWLNALNMDPSGGLRQFLIPRFSIKQLVDLPL